MSNLYDILTDNGNQLTLKMAEGHPVYQGHFPGNPITPGVLTLKMVRECVSRYIGRELHYASIKSCRLVAMVRPGDTLRLTMETREEEGNVSLKADLFGAEDDDDLRLHLDAVCG